MADPRTAHERSDGFGLRTVVLECPRTVSSAGFDVIGSLWISDATLVVLAAGTAAALAWSWKNRSRERVLLLSMTIGVAAAYGVSEALKLVFAQTRPCGRWASVGECHLGDYSFPSNHATLAFGAVWLITIAVGAVWSTLLSSALASVVAVGRMLEGVHYLHDVAAGAMLGLAVPGVAGGVVALVATVLSISGVCSAGFERGAAFWLGALFAVSGCAGAVGLVMLKTGWGGDVNIGAGAVYLLGMALMPVVAVIAAVAAAITACRADRPLPA